MSTESEFDQLKGLAAPARRALASAGYTRIEQLARARHEDVAKLHGLGANGLTVLRQALVSKGLDFRSD